MRILLFALCLARVTSIQALKDPAHGYNDWFIVDTIEAVVFSKSPTLITYSDLEKMNIDGSPRSLESMIKQQLIINDGEGKVDPTDEEVDRHLKDVQRENNLTHDQLVDIFKNSGFTWEEAKEEFKKFTTMNSMIDFKVRSAIYIPKREVEKYAEEHPEIVPALYQLKYAFVPFDRADHNKQKNDLKRALALRRETAVEWSEPFWVSESELAEDKKFVVRMKKEQIAPMERHNGFEIIRLADLVEEHERSLEERYSEIINIKRRAKFEEASIKYTDSLYARTPILYFNKEYADSAAPAA